jgi:predicted transcriptional regulator
MDLRGFRKMLELTQEEVAAETGISQPTISRIESGEVDNTRLDVVRRIQRWADEIARRRRLPRSKRLTWGSLRCEDDAA